jgi:hypothetical protein
VQLEVNDGEGGMHFGEVGIESGELLEVGLRLG